MNILAALKSIASIFKLIKEAWGRITEARRVSRIGKIEQLAEKRNKLLSDMQTALDKKDFVLYEKLFDEYSGLKNE